MSFCSELAVVFDPKIARRLRDDELYDRIKDTDARMAVKALMRFFSTTSTLNAMTAEQTKLICRLKECEGRYPEYLSPNMTFLFRGLAKSIDWALSVNWKPFGSGILMCEGSYTAGYTIQSWTTDPTIANQFSTPYADTFQNRAIGIMMGASIPKTHLLFSDEGSNQVKRILDLGLMNEHEILRLVNSPLRVRYTLDMKNMITKWEIMNWKSRDKLILPYKNQLNDLIKLSGLSHVM